MEADGNITVRIRDDGRGMRGDVSDTSFGLIGMRERVALVGNAQGRIPGRAREHWWRRPSLRIATIRLEPVGLSGVRQLALAAQSRRGGHPSVSTTSGCQRRKCSVCWGVSAPGG